MKIVAFNEKVFKEKVLSIGKTTVERKPKSTMQHYIPLDFFKGDGLLSIENTLNILPKPLRDILQNGNNPIAIKSNSSLIEIKTDTGLIISIKTDTIDDRIPQVKIFDKGSKTELLNTYKR
jgi:hypothetical protein